MKRIAFIITLLGCWATSALSQSTPPLTLQEIDGNPKVVGVTTIKVTNGVLSCTGKTCTITISGGGGGSPGGSSGQVQYNNSGSFGGITGATTNGTTLTLVAPILGTPASVTLTNGTGLPISTGLTGAGTGVLTALGVNVGTAGAFVVNGGALGTPSSGTLTSATGLPISTGLTGAGTGVLTALGINVGSAGAFVTFNGAGGTPSSITLTNATGLPIAGITGLGTGVGTWLATPSSANLAAAVTDETGSGALVFGTSPDFTTGITIGGVAVPTISSTSTFTNKTLTSSTNVLGTVTMTLGSDADGDTYYRSSNVLTRLAKGTAGQCYQMNGGATAPTWGSCGGASGITVGTTTITSGTTGRVPYNNGGVYGEISTLTSDGTIVTFAPTVTTGTGASAGVVGTANSLTTGNGFDFSSSSVTSGNIFKITSTSTAAASNTLTGLNIAISGANASTAQTVRGAIISVTNTNATSGTNTALTLTASGATTANQALNVTAGQILVPDGALSAPAYSFSNASTTMGLSRSGSWMRLSGLIAVQNTFVLSPSNGNFGFTATTTDPAAGTYSAGFTRPAGSTIALVGGSGANAAATFSTPANTPAQITADQNNYAPGAGWFQRWSSDASRNITGLAAGQDGQIVEVWNVGSNNIVLVNESASSTAANRFTTSTGADLTLSAAKCAQLRYDVTSTRWRAYLCN